MIMSHTERVVILVDMDCFYCQVEEQLNPSLKNKPMAVVQYNQWRGGGIIAVNYEARNRGVTRHMRGADARHHCPEIELVSVPTQRGKANLNKYRDAGKTVAKILQRFTPLLERASVDEAYLDITEAVKDRMQSDTGEVTPGQLKNTAVVGCDTLQFIYDLYNSGLHSKSKLRLAYGGVIVEEIRAAVFEETGYTCSAGVAHNKILAKLAAGLHKPNKQTILPQDSVAQLYETLPVQKIRSLGGKFGDTLSDDLGISTMAELERFSLKELNKRYDEKTASFLYNIARGVDAAPVTVRLTSKCIGCSKNFTGKSALTDADSIKHWLAELAEELVERLEQDTDENNRKARQVTVGFSQEINGKNVASTKIIPLPAYDAGRISSNAYQVIQRNCMGPGAIFCVKHMGLSAGKFEGIHSVDIASFFQNATDTVLKKLQDADSDNNENDSKTNKESNTDSPQSTLNKHRNNWFTSYFKNNLKTQELLQRDTIHNNETNKTDESTTCTTTVDDETSPFSAETINLEENSSEIVFLDEHSDDSISNEIGETPPKEKPSFFQKYFENLKKDRQSPPARDFNTSIMLENESIEEPEDLDRPGLSTGLVQPDPSPATEICTKCKKKIPVDEMPSHQDYHFALKIVQEESNLHKLQIERDRSPSKGKVEKQKNNKRKSKENTLEAFFKPSKVEDLEDSKACPECDRKIKSDEFSSHLDYHAAKRLHLEINKKSCAVENAKKEKGKIKPKTAALSVTHFFKPQD